MVLLASSSIVPLADIIQHVSFDCFMQRGTPIDIEDAAGRTALQMAGEERQRDAVRWLLANGASKHKNHAQVVAALLGGAEDAPHSFLQQAIVKVCKLIEICATRR